MTSPISEPSAPDSAPPPGCPAHGVGPGGVARLFGPGHDEDPYEFYERLRKDHGAVAPVLVPGDHQAWLVLGHRENLEVARTPSLFSRDPRLWRDMQEGKVPPDNPLAPVTRWEPLCVFVEGEEHARLRKAVTDSLSRFETRGIRRHVVRFSNELIDKFIHEGRVDLVSQFAEQLPLRVMTQLFGMNESYGPELVHAVRDMISGSETAGESDAVVTQALKELVERSRANPRHDLASKLLEHEAQLTEKEAWEHLRLMKAAGHEPTAYLLANTLKLILTDRRIRGTLAGGHMTLPDALEQVMWDEPPMTTNIARYATGDTALGGKTIKKGDMLILGLAAGNFDPAIRPDLNVSVQGNRSHLAFSGGPHECPGKDLGLAIVETGIDTLLSRIPDLRLAVPEESLERTATPMQFGYKALPSEFEAKRRKQAAVQKPPVELPPQQPAPASAPLPEAVPVPARGRASWLRRLREKITTTGT